MQTLDRWGFELTTLAVIGTDCIGSCESNYNTITTTMDLKNSEGYINYNISYHTEIVLSTDGQRQRNNIIGRKVF
jgi:hypothetical protein